MRNSVQDRREVNRSSPPLNWEGIPTILFTFDDGWESQYTNGYRILNEYGVKGTIYVISNKVDTTGFCSVSQLEEVYSDGWCIANHTMNHAILTNLSDGEAISEVIGCQEWLRTNGFNRGLAHIAWPYGGPKDTLEYSTSTANAGFKTQRSADDGYNIPTTHNLYLNGINCLKVKSLNQNVSIATAKSYVDEAIRTKKSVMFMLHIVDSQGNAQNSSYFTPENLETLVYYVVKKNLRILSVDEYYEGLTNPRFTNKIISRSDIL